jgi:hypothetical protein
MPAAPACCGLSGAKATAARSFRSTNAPGRSATPHQVPIALDELGAARGRGQEPGWPVCGQIAEQAGYLRSRGWCAPCRPLWSAGDGLSFWERCSGRNNAGLAAIRNRGRRKVCSSQFVPAPAHYRGHPVRHPDLAAGARGRGPRHPGEQAGPVLKHDRLFVGAGGR